MRLDLKDLWDSKKVLVTGHTGFKGAWLSFYLSELGANVQGMGLEPTGPTSLYSDLNLRERLSGESRIDVRNFARVRLAIEKFQPEVIFHLAAQAFVGSGYRSPLATIATNVMGTSNLMEATRQAGETSVFISVTSDKVYANHNTNRSFGEADPMGGHDPYSASKAAADIISQMFSSAYFSESGIAVGIARAGNVIGGGDWAQGRLFPDLVRAWSSNEQVRLRLPLATRPWQHVLEPLRGYLALAEKLFGQPELSGPLNFGPNLEDSLAVEDVVRIASDFWPGNSGWTTDSDFHFHESRDLAIDNSRARELLNLEPVWESTTAIKRTTHWYREYFAGAPAERLCLGDIRAFEAGK